MPKNLYAKRAFLNKDIEMSGYIVAVVPALEFDEDKFVLALYPSLEIKDCSRQITLDFSTWSVKNAKDNKQKLSLLRKIINDFADKAEEQIDTYIEIKSNEPKKPKRKRKHAVLVQ